MPTPGTHTGYRPKHRAAFPVDWPPNVAHGSIRVATHPLLGTRVRVACPACSPTEYAAHYATHKKVI